MTISTLLAVIAFPFVLPLIVSAILWRKLDRPWLFLVVSFLCLASIDEMSFEAIWALLEPTVSTKGTANAVEAITAVSHMRIVSLLIADAVVLVIGLPLLYWLFTALRRQVAIMAK